MKPKLKSPKDRKRKRRHLRVRRKIVGTAERPRVCVFRSNLHIYAQIVDDLTGQTIAAASSLKVTIPQQTPAATGPVATEPAAAAVETAPEAPKGKKKGDKAADKKGEKKGEKKGDKKGEKKERPVGRKILQAREVGRLLAEAAKAKGIKKVRFDRGGYLYHGRVAALAQALREGGLEL
jgi:large subunit ribosomal protein L18